MCACTCARFLHDCAYLCTYVFVRVPVRMETRGDNCDYMDTSAEDRLCIFNYFFLHTMRREEWLKEEKKDERRRRRMKGGTGGGG